MYQCSHCQAELAANAQFCTRCGTPTEESQTRSADLAEASTDEAELESTSKLQAVTTPPAPALPTLRTRRMHPQSSIPTFPPDPWLPGSAEDEDRTTVIKPSHEEPETPSPALQFPLTLPDEPVQDSSHTQKESAEAASSVQAAPVMPHASNEAASSVQAELAQPQESDAPASPIQEATVAQDEPAEAAPDLSAEAADLPIDALDTVSLPATTPEEISTGANAGEMANATQADTLMLDANADMAQADAATIDANANMTQVDTLMLDANADMAQADTIIIDTNANMTQADEGEMVADTAGEMRGDEEKMVADTAGETRDDEEEMVAGAGQGGEMVAGGREMETSSISASGEPLRQAQLLADAPGAPGIAPMAGGVVSPISEPSFPPPTPEKMSTPRPATPLPPSVSRPGGRSRGGRTLVVVLIVLAGGAGAFAFVRLQASPGTSSQCNAQQTNCPGSTAVVVHGKTTSLTFSGKVAGPMSIVAKPSCQSATSGSLRTLTVTLSGTINNQLYNFGFAIARYNGPGSYSNATASITILFDVPGESTTNGWGNSAATDTGSITVERGEQTGSISYTLSGVGTQAGTQIQATGNWTCGN